MLKAPEYLADRQLESRGYFADLRHPVTGRHRYDGSPLLFHDGFGTETGERGHESWLPPPMLGEHNWLVLRDLLGMGEEEYDGLVREGILATRPG